MAKVLEFQLQHQSFQWIFWGRFPLELIGLIFFQFKGLSRVFSVQFSLVVQSCLTLCNSMDCSMPGLPVHHQLLELTQTHVHWVHNAIQPSHPLSSPSPQPSIFPSIRVFQMSHLFTSGGQSTGVSTSASVLPMNIQDLSPLGWPGWISLQSKGLSRVFSNTAVQKHQFFGTQRSS